MTDLQHTATRMIAIAQSWHDDPEITQGKIDSMRSLAEYLLHTAADLEYEPPAPGAQLDTQLAGKRLPDRPPYSLGKPRTMRYGAVIRDEVRDFNGAQISGVSSSGVIMYGNCEISNFTTCVSGGDGLKFDGGAIPGSFVVRNAHIHSLGLTPGAHADGLQTRGGVTSGLFEDVYFDMPALAGDGTQANACLMVSSAQRPNGTFTFRRCILRGGNFSVMIGDKDSGNDPGRLHFEETAFIIEDRSPQYGLFNDGGARATFGPGCAVYRLGADGHCQFVTDDVASFRL